MSSSKKSEILDISNKQLEILRWKSARRKQLRELYLKHEGHPTKHNLFFDEGLMRFAAMKLTQEWRFKGNFASFITYVAMPVSAIALLTIWINKTKADEEYQYRTGQVSYADREFKFK